MSSPSSSLWTSMFSKRPVIKRRDSSASSKTCESKDTIMPATATTKATATAATIKTEESETRPVVPQGASYRLKTFDSNTDIEEPIVPNKKRSVLSLFISRKRTSVASVDDEDLGSMPSLSSSASFSSSSSSEEYDFLPLPIERLSSYKHHFTIRGQAIDDRSSFDSTRTSFESPRKLHFWQLETSPAVLNMVEEPEYDEVIDWSADQNQNNVYLGRV